MKSQNWAQTHIIVFVSLLFASCPCLLCEAFGEESNSLETHSAMLTFSKTIKSLDKALAGDDAQKIIHLATVLKEASQRATSDLEPQKNGEMFQVFNEHLTRIGSL